MLEKIKALLGLGGRAEASTADSGSRGSDVASSGVAEVGPASREVLRAALVRLLERTNDDAFVIFDAHGTGKFVQFAGGHREGLRFDLPSQPLDGGEFAKAGALLSEYGIPFEAWDLVGQTELPPETQGSFSADMGRDVERASTAAWRVFVEVYGLQEGFAMAVTEN
ncbi:MAG: hypothetical protein AAGM22_21315 [Acidobacteriota bacterium]